MIANDRSYGLASGMWTQNVGTRHRITGRTARGYGLGEQLPRVLRPAVRGLPGGAFGREIGKAYLHGYTEVKSIWIDLS